MLGDGSEWVRNVRAAGGKAFVKRDQSRPVAGGPHLQPFKEYTSPANPWGAQFLAVCREVGLSDRKLTGKLGQVVND
jgi:hypothetical protein